MTNLLTATSLDAGHEGRRYVEDFNVRVDQGKIVALIGPNGAGKSTTLSTLAGELPSLGGTITVDGGAAPSRLHQMARDGMAYVTEERSLFMSMSINENLRIARCDPDLVFEVFPELEPIRKRRAGLCSGGEQQMLTIGRALARRPRLMLIDELSLGLAPLVVGRLLEAVREAADRGVGVLLVEQHVERALTIADEGIVLNRGRTVLRGTAAEVSARMHDIEKSYLKAGA